MPACSGLDKGCDITPRGSGQTSRWSSVTREPWLTDSRGKADMSAEATLPGAAPGPQGSSAPGAYREGGPGKPSKPQGFRWHLSVRGRR